MFVRQHTGKQPLEVAADRIARASHAALDALERLRRAIGASISLAWTEQFDGVAVIEVYPAATLRASGVVEMGYGRLENAKARVRIATALRHEISNLGEYVGRSPHVFDACLCLVAAKHFLDGCAMAPPEELIDAARKEGWIWVRGLDPHPTASTSPSRERC